MAPFLHECNGKCLNYWEGRDLGMNSSFEVQERFFHLSLINVFRLSFSVRIWGGLNLESISSLEFE